MGQENTQIPGIYNNGDYLSKNESWHSEKSPWKADQIEKILSKNMIKFETVCEAGCGAGEILKELSLKPGFETAKFFGYEVSQDAYELCKANESGRISFKLSDINTEDVHYDILLCIDVIEHVEDYMGFTRKLREKSKYKVFHIPLDLSVSALLRGTLMKGRKRVGHLHYFTPKTAIATLEDCGYEILDTAFTPAFENHPSKQLGTTLLNLPRKLMFSASPNLMSTLVGGCSLLVLAK